MKHHPRAVKTGMATMAVKAFVDTDILLRAFLIDMDLHTQCAALLKKMWRDGAGRRNTRVIRQLRRRANGPDGACYTVFNSRSC